MLHAQGGAAARRLLERRAGDTLRRRRDVQRRASPDDVHDLRVATRRLQEAIDLLAFALPGPERRRARRRARAIRRGLAEVRDADVLLEMVTALAAGAVPGEGRALSALRRRLAARARDTRGRVGARIGAQAGARTEARTGAGDGGADRPVLVGPGMIAGRLPPPGLKVPGLRRRARALLRALPPVPAAALRDAATRFLATRVEAVLAGLARATTGRAADLHRLRVAVKKYRYTLEAMHEAGVGGHARAITAAKQVQEALGRLHDVDVLIALLRGGAGGAAGPVMRRLRRERGALLVAARAVAAGFRPATWPAAPAGRASGARSGKRAGRRTRAA